QRDRVGLATFDGDLVDYVPPSARHLQQVLHGLERASRGSSVESQLSTPDPRLSAPRASLLPPLKKLSESTHRRSIIALISDFYEEPDAIMDAVAQLHGRGNDIVVFHILDRNEIEFPFTDSSNFIDMESGEKMPVIPQYLRKQYKEIIAHHSAALARRTREATVDYALFDTSKPLDAALFTYLSSRQRLSRVR